jgi:hypothetical protein
LVCSLKPATYGELLDRATLRRRFRTACSALGRERLAGLTIHHGLHTFVSPALAGGRSIAEVRDAAASESGEVKRLPAVRNAELVDESD